MPNFKQMPMALTQGMREAMFAPKGYTVDGYVNPHTLDDKYQALIAAAPDATQEPDRVPDECCATGQSCEYAYDTVVKAYQCRYCGGQPPASWTPPLRLPFPETIGDAQVYHFDQLEDLLKAQGVNYTVGIE